MAESRVETYIQKGGLDPDRASQVAETALKLKKA